MPELPEVETVRKGLENIVVGKVIDDIDVFWPRLIEDSMSVGEWKRAVEHQKIQSIGRRGKFLVFYLDSGIMVSHLRMEGKYDYHINKDEEPDKHTHIIFYFTDGTSLHYNDVRKFGRFAYVPYKQVNQYFHKKNLGVEPLTDAFNIDYFEESLSHSPSKIKALLLSQKIVVGLGNIYVDESLFNAGIHPKRSGNSLSKDEVKRLYDSINQVLSDAIKAGGSTIRTYKNTLGELGKFQQSLNVYGKQGQPCIKCHTPIEKIKIAQRGTHICPYCQK